MRSPFLYRVLTLPEAVARGPDPGFVFRADQFSRQAITISFPIQAVLCFVRCRTLLRGARSDRPDQLFVHKPTSCSKKEQNVPISKCTRVGFAQLFGIKIVQFCA
jgi:hypothetical protein